MLQTAKQKGTTDSEPIKQDESRWFTHHVFSVLEMFWDFSASKGVLFVSNFQNTRDFIILRRCSSKKKKPQKRDGSVVGFVFVCASMSVGGIFPFGHFSLLPSIWDGVFCSGIVMVCFRYR